MVANILAVNMTFTTSTTPAPLNYPANTKTSGVYIFNVATDVLFVKSGPAGTVADTTCNFVPPNMGRLFKRGPDDVVLSVLLASGTGKAYANSQSDVDG